VNYLAHAYLSFNDPEVLTGNLISDFVKGKKKFEYQPRILKGIELHREIDSFTDDHTINKSAAKIFKPAYGLYAAAFLDVTYNDIASFHAVLPVTFKNIFPYMRQHNWLYNYQFSFGIRNSFEGLAHRAKYISEGRTAYDIFEKNYDSLKSAYGEFFPQLMDFSLGKFSDIH
jgi:acyl carrier protein phosphodiesterase